MVKLLKSAILSLVIAGFFYEAQAQDSLKMYSLPKWKLDRLLDARFYDLPKAEGTIVKLDSTVQALKMTVEASEKLTDIRTTERDIQVRINEKSDSISENLKVIHKEEVKQVKRKGWRKLGAGAVLGFVLAAVFL